MFLQAESISREAAQKTAQQFLMGRGKYLSQDKLNLAHRAPQRGAGPRSSKAAYYVFNADNNQGYVLVSASTLSSATPSAAVYNLSGQLVGKAVQHKGVWQLQHLPKGVYVVQGQRVMR